MIRVDYEKTEENSSSIKTTDLESTTSTQSLTSTIEKLKSSLNNSSNGNTSSSSNNINSNCDTTNSSTNNIKSNIPSDISVINNSSQNHVINPNLTSQVKQPSLAERCLELLLGYGVTPQQVTTLQRGNGNTAVDRLVSKAAQMNQLQSQMSPTHKQTLHYSSTQQLTHRAAASAVLSLLTDAQLSSLERSLLDLTKWTGDLKQVGIRWELSVKPPTGQGPRKCFIIEKRQLRELGLDTSNCKIYKASNFDLSEREVKLYFGATFLSVPRNVFDDSDIETID